MGQIINKKKRGRPPKSDLATRPRNSEPESEPRARRSLRRRNVRYNFIDYDDFIDDDYFEEEEDEEDEEEERRREKKVKLVMKLNQGSRDGHASGSEDEGNEEEEEEDEGSERRVVKKRRIIGCDEDEQEEEVGGVDDDGEARKLVKGSMKELEPHPGMQAGAPTRVPLPDKKKLELILDKLQKKDTYGVYAEPVDPEELPDYHDVIQHPMDFSTVRKKLANGSYSTLDQFESDIFLICSNAMQYNASDTIYHKQARTIQELGQKKFHKLRIDYERSEQEPKSEHKSKIDFEGPEKEPKSDQRTKSSLLVKKQIKKPVPRYLQEPVGSDFSAGAILAGDLQNNNVSSANQVGSYERPINNDGILESSNVIAGNNLDKAEELSIERGLQPKFWRKPFTVDENRRATYNISNQPAVKEQSIFTTFDEESRQLITVGLHMEYSYSRSLARFAATLGPIAWRVASQRIEQAVPSGCKFGHGWVGEYEPPPTPVLLVQNRVNKDSSPLATNSQHAFVSRKDEVLLPTKTSVSTKEKLGNSSTKFEVKPSLLHAHTIPSTLASPRLNSNTAAVNSKSFRTDAPVSRSYGGPGNRVVKQFELNSLPSPNQSSVDYVTEKKLSEKVETAAPRPGEIVSKNSQKDVSESAAAASRSRGSFRHGDGSGVIVGRGLSNGKVGSNNSSSDYNRVSSSPSSSGVPNEMQRPSPAYFLRQDQGGGGFSDPVQMMRMLAEKAQQQQNSSNGVADDALPSMRRDCTSGNNNSAATAAASVWMSIGAAAAENSSSPRSQTPPTTDSSSTFHNTSREPHLQQQLPPPPQRVRGEFPASSGGAHFQHVPAASFMQAPTNEVQLPNRQMVFPQLMNVNLSRFQPQMMMPWRGLTPHSQQQASRAKQETLLPPDLNIGFQSPGSPVTTQSSAVKMDSQQPDLALQL